MSKEITNQRVTQKEKDADDKKYYREQLDSLDGQSFSRRGANETVSERQKMKVNYDLFNNILNVNELSYVCTPFGAQVGELPATMTNRDIISGKIKAIMGMEMKRPFSWASIAVNEEATTRKEQVEFNMIKDFVVNSIMQPIREEAELKYQQQANGGKLTPEQMEQIKAEIAQETEAKTPPEVRKYISREHQDPAEMLSNQILRYLMQKENIKDKFNKCFKHAMIAGREVAMIGISNGEPFVRVVNNLFFDYGKTQDSDLIEDSPWGVLEFSPSLSELLTQFRTELNDDDVKYLYSVYDDGRSNGDAYASTNLDRIFDFGSNAGGVDVTTDSIRVVYGAWKAERKIGYLSYTDRNSEEQLMIVDENYKLQPELGDIKIEWDWIPEVHHGYKICTPEPIYVGLGAYPGQHRDLDNLNECKLPFIGVDYDDLNSEVTSPIDRIKGYQYFLDIVLYRIELLLASDKGKILLMNIASIPTSAGIDLKKFQYFLEANKLAYFNPNEEKNKKGTADVNTHAKVLDMSLASNIAQYIDFAEYLERKAGEAVGVPKEMEAQISSDQSVRNVQQTISASSNILEPYFQRHNTFKRNVLQHLIDTAKVAYSQGKPRKLSYILDDHTQAIINLDENAQGLLSDSTLGIFVADSTNAADTKRTIEQLAHSAMQTQQMDLLDIVKVMRADGMQEAEEALEVGVNKKAQQESQRQIQLEQMKSKNDEAQRAHEAAKAEKEHGFKIAEIDRKGEWDIKKQTILSMGFNEDKDLDDDGTPDVLEVAKFGVEADIKHRELALKERAQTENTEIALKKIEVDKEKNAILKTKKPVGAK